VDVVDELGVECRGEARLKRTVGFCYRVESGFVRVAVERRDVKKTALKCL
jgi:hypothetical protein